jgi:ubiquitin-like 1-activating enzyme E1 B
MILPSPLPNPAKRAKPPRASTTPPTPPRIQKRPAPDGLDGAQPAKRARMATGHKHSSSESRRLEEDGLVLLDGDGPVDEDIDIVVID